MFNFDLSSSIFQEFVLNFDQMSSLFQEFVLNFDLVFSLFQQLAFHFDLVFSLFQELVLNFDLVSSIFQEFVSKESSAVPPSPPLVSMRATPVAQRQDLMSSAVVSGLSTPIRCVTIGKNTIFRHHGALIFGARMCNKPPQAIELGHLELVTFIFVN